VMGCRADPRPELSTSSVSRRNGLAVVGNGDARTADFAESQRSACDFGQRLFRRGHEELIAVCRAPQRLRCAERTATQPWILALNPIGFDTPSHRRAAGVTSEARTAPPLPTPRRRL